MRKTMKASTLRDNQSHDNDRATKPYNSTECRRRRLCRLLVIALGSAAPLDMGDVKVSAAANVGQRSPPKDGRNPAGRVLRGVV